MHFADTKTRAHKRALKITHNAVVVVVVVVMMMMMFESENRLGARASRIVDGIEGMTPRTAEDDATDQSQRPDDVVRAGRVPEYRRGGAMEPRRRFVRSRRHGNPPSRRPRHWSRTRAKLSVPYLAFPFARRV